MAREAVNQMRARNARGEGIYPRDRELFVARFKMK